MPASVATLEKKLRDYQRMLERHDIDSRSSQTRILHSKADLEKWIAKTKAQIEKAKARRRYKHMPNEQDGGRRKSRRRKSRRGTRRH